MRKLNSRCGVSNFNKLQVVQTNKKYDQAKLDDEYSYYTKKLNLFEF